MSGSAFLVFNGSMAFFQICLPLLSVSLEHIRYNCYGTPKTPVCCMVHAAFLSLVSARGQGRVLA